VSKTKNKIRILKKKIFKRTNEKVHVTIEKWMIGCEWRIVETPVCKIVSLSAHIPFVHWKIHSYLFSNRKKHSMNWSEIYRKISKHKILVWTSIQWRWAS
jgi:hypothetical protein